MKSKAFEQEIRRQHVLIFETNDEVMEILANFARRNRIRAGHFTAIGALRSASLAFFDPEAKEYIDIPVEEQTEVVLLTGNLAWKGDEPIVHAHALLGRRDGSTIGGHVLKATVRPTLELFLDPGGELERETDETSGLPLIALDS